MWVMARRAGRVDWLSGVLGWLPVALLLGGMVALVSLTATGAQQDDPKARASRDFLRVWMRADRPVLEGHAQRTWVWGQMSGGVIEEPYAEAPGGTRLVQYTDKSRMELTDPSLPNDPRDPWRVTNGLLVRELMTGQLQLGHTQFEQRAPAAINVAGDPAGLGPTYRDLAALISAPTALPGAAITAVIDADGSVSHDARLAIFGVTAGYHAPETGHAIANVFVEFLTSEGLIFDADWGYHDGQLFQSMFYPAGLPLTEAYWATVDVGGTPQLVLVQAFERRVLTYTPTNEPAWQVEAGNVGQHYYRWRYGAEPAAAFPLIPSVGSAGHPFQLGLSVKGRPIEAVRIGEGMTTIVCIGGIHTGEEINTTKLVQQLLAQLRSHPEAVDPNVAIILIPLLNPDGAARGTRTNANDVDLNRNWPSGWQPWAYHGAEVVSAGAAPLSEPEVAQLHQMLLTLRPDAVLSWHAALPPNGSAEGNDLPEGDALAAVFAERSGVEYLDEWQLYPVSGQLIDTMRDAGIPAVDIELPDHTGTNFDANLNGLLGVIDYLVAR